MTSIHTLLNNLEFSDLTIKLQEFDCHVSLFHGRKFTLEGCEGDVSFNEIVYSVYQKALQHAGEVKGKEIYQNLLDLHQMGENELQTKPWWVRVVTLLKRIFTFWSRNYYLKHIQEWQGYHSVRCYYRDRTDELLKAIQERGVNITHDQLRVVDWTSVDNHVLTTRRVDLTIKTPLAIASKNYQGLEEFKASAVIDETQRLDAQFQEFKTAVQQALPEWIEARHEMDSMAFDLRKHINKYLGDWRSQQKREVDCELEDLEFSIELSVSANCSWLCAGKVKFRTISEQAEEHREFQLKKVTMMGLGSDAFVDLKKEWMASIDKKLKSFLKNVNESSQFTAEEERLFEELFGEDFFNDFEKDFFGNDKNITLQKVSEYLTIMETIMQEPSTLLSFLNEKKYAELQEASKKLWKKAALQLHPDKAKARGLSIKEIDKATEQFKEFGDAYFNTMKWLREQQLENERIGV